MHSYIYQSTFFVFDEAFHPTDKDSIDYLAQSIMLTDLFFGILTQFFYYYFH